MKTACNRVARDARQSAGNPNLKPLVDPLAAYVAAAADPKTALVEVLTLLVVETNSIEAAARRYLGSKR